MLDVASSFGFAAPAVAGGASGATEAERTPPFQRAATDVTLGALTSAPGSFGSLVLDLGAAVSGAANVVAGGSGAAFVDGAEGEAGTGVAGAAGGLTVVSGGTASLSSLTGTAGAVFTVRVGLVVTEACAGVGFKRRCHVDGARRESRWDLSSNVMKSHENVMNIKKT